MYHDVNSMRPYVIGPQHRVPNINITSPNIIGFRHMNQVLVNSSIQKGTGNSFPSRQKYLIKQNPQISQLISSQLFRNKYNPEMTKKSDTKKLSEVLNPSKAISGSGWQLQITRSRIELAETMNNGLSRQQYCLEKAYI
ncbi:UNKNOWN [Stylonychia lemnae]|uniref:Uncharacterized protein n=1 Tax=Stylonychia lemnae TaxID=5949 RepID=A0A077ZS62_STYLE|nr:UNKNOWN [Stylonychia lemnae]|eukprot:CDW72334.1 UNKNOWN [Stylonychia lemnae]